MFTSFLQVSLHMYRSLLTYLSYLRCHTCFNRELHNAQKETYTRGLLTASLAKEVQHTCQQRAM